MTLIFYGWLLQFGDELNRQKEKSKCNRCDVRLKKCFIFNLTSKNYFNMFRSLHPAQLWLVSVHQVQARHFHITRSTWTVAVTHLWFHASLQQCFPALVAPCEGDLCVDTHAAKWSPARKVLGICSRPPSHRSREVRRFRFGFNRFRVLVSGGVCFPGAGFGVCVRLGLLQEG